MRRFGLLIIAALLALTPLAARADRGFHGGHEFRHDGGFHHHRDFDHDRFHSRFFFGGFYDPFFYPYYDYAAPYAYGYPYTYSYSPPAPANVWYYCPTANVYYPYVPSCPVPWQPVTPR